MFCRKCGAELTADCKFCYNCGTKTEAIPAAEIVAEPFSVPAEEITDDASVNEIYIGEAEEKESNPEATPKAKKINTTHLVIISVVVGLLILIACCVYEATRCDYYDGCSNKALEDRHYCAEHTCIYDNCTSGKGYNSNYCYLHQCAEILCPNAPIAGSDYCSDHTCSAEGCTALVIEDTQYCADHQLIMRDRLDLQAMSFSLNSADGIKFSFEARNKTGKTIKYVRFKVYLQNAVGDTIRDDISHKNYVSVEMIGPIEPTEKITVHDEIIGYCENLSRIDVRDITIVYTDGTSETGSYNYYYTK